MFDEVFENLLKGDDSYFNFVNGNVAIILLAIPCCFRLLPFVLSLENSSNTNDGGVFSATREVESSSVTHVSRETVAVVTC